MDTEKQAMIYAIQKEREKYPLIKASDFGSYIENACSQSWRVKKGAPSARFMKVARAYLNEMQACEDFKDVSKPFFKT